jgi:hypothetical protein
VAVNISIHKKSSLPGEKRLPQGGFSENLRFGFYGMVTEVHPEDNTVHVRMDTGRELSGLRVASLEWVTIDNDKGFLSGQRRLPPVNTFVFCITPDGDPARGVVLFSAFGFQVAEHAAFKEDSEDAKHIKKRVTNSGWVFTEDNRTGTMIAQNKPEKPTIKIEVDQESEGEEKGTITVHGNIFTIDKNEGVRFQTDKNVKIDADGTVTVKSTKKEKLEFGNAIATMGAMISDFLQAAISFSSVGSPGAHTAPDFSATAGQIKAKWDQVFK